MDDFEKYRRAWNNELAFNRATVTQPQIRDFMSTQSKGLKNGYRNALIFDMVLKMALVFALTLLAFWLDADRMTNWTWVFVALLGYGIYHQYRAYARIPPNGWVTESATTCLEGQLDYFHHYYHRAMLVSALSSALVFVTGSFYYYLFKYQKLPNFQVDDLLVLILGALLAYGVSAFAQIMQGDYQIKQLEEILEELTEGKDNRDVLSRFRQAKTRNILIISLLFMAGVGLLIFFFIHMVAMQ